MSKLRVDELQARQSQQQVDPGSTVSRRQELHRSSSFARTGPATFAGIGRPDLSALRDGADAVLARQGKERPRSIAHTYSNGQTVQIPCLTRSEVGRAEQAFGRLGARRPEGEEVALRLGAALWQEAEDNPAGIPVEAVSAGLESAVDDSYALWMLTEGKDQRDGASEEILFAGMWGVEKNLHGFFNACVERENVSNEMRSVVAELKDMLAEWPEGESEILSWREIESRPDGSTEIVEHNNVALTRDQAAALLDRLEPMAEQMSSIVNQDQFKLQYMVEQYQQLSTTLSNILKNQDDTRKNIIGHLKA